MRWIDLLFIEFVDKDSVKVQISGVICLTIRLWVGACVWSLWVSGRWSR